MALVFPSEGVARRWDGALQARLRRAPLEAFLRARSIVPAPAGVSQDSDNLARVTVLIVEAGLALYLEEREEGLAFHQRAMVGRAACLVSHTLAELISEPKAWRIAALVSSARLLSPWMGLNAAAVASACSVRQFQKERLRTASSLDGQIAKGACAALNRNDVEIGETVSVCVAAYLNTAEAQNWNRAAVLREQHAGD
jgi:hypothetical protein